MGIMRAGVVGQFAVVAAAWGSSFLFIKVGLGGLTPGQVVWARLVFGSLALAAIMLVTRRAIPREPRVWGHLTVVALLLCVFPFLLFAWAETRISSGLASIFNATTPLLTMAIGAVALASERLTRDRALGLVLGFVGVVVIIGPWAGIDFGHELLAQLACLGATFCYGCSFVYLRRFVAPLGIPAVSVAFVQVTIAAVIMLAATPWLTATPPRLDLPIVLSMLALGAIGTGLAYLLNMNVVRAWGAANASAVTYLSPVVGVALGVTVLGEPLTWNQPVGAVLVILGIVASHGKLRTKRREPISVR
ncbi:DMT family transporter [Amycolatopsis minnesotensis]|uniref:DMT family transporter n=2 Tax=Amycolatopsis minnesotensis TaxID=337894 RepID=A0ABN2RDG0_9PSEU